MERPILFSTPMVQAILDGRKTQTRRIIKFSIRSNSGKFLNSRYEEIKPICQSGDTLWVRETWCRGKARNGDNKTIYKADIEPDLQSIHVWKPSIHMPKEYARLFLTVKNVRVERLQDITEEDARAEGVMDPYDYQSPEYYEQPYMRGLEINQSAFAGLWDSCYQWPKTWLANPWVWVIEFERK